MNDKKTEFEKPLILVKIDAKGNIEAVLFKGIDDQSDVGLGIVLADIIRDLEIGSGHNPEEILRVIRRELDNPTSPIQGTFIQ